MAKIDLEKVLIALLDSPFNKQFDDKVKDALKKQGLEYRDGEIVESQKPKFKVGDWIINRTDATIMQIINNTDFYESIEIGGQRRTDTYNYVEWDFRLWSIEDAKDGDILQLGEVTAIFKEYIGNGYCKCYCSICEGEFEILIEEAGDNIFGCINTTPATKEQRELLFQKMEEAGYKWDAKKKELKKVDRTKDLSNYIKFLKSFHCWNKIQREIMDKYLEEQIKKNYSPEEDEELFFGDFRKTDSEDKGTASFANRQVYNRAILKLLSDYVEKYPDIRFGQMLYNLGVNPHFNEESRETYCNLNKIINKRK